MTLVKDVLKLALDNAFTAAENEAKRAGSTELTVRNVLCENMATAIDAYIKTGTVVVSAGIAVATAGSAFNQVGATTAPGNGIIE